MKPTPAVRGSHSRSHRRCRRDSVGVRSPDSAKVDYCLGRCRRVFDSFVFKYHHNDFEDDLMLGVANRIDADYVVTEDKNLIKHTNGVCINVQQALKLVEGSNVPSARPV